MRFGNIFFRDFVEVNGTYYMLDMRYTVERQGHNPANGESITIPATDTITFKVSKKFKDMLNG